MGRKHAWKVANAKTAAQTGTSNAPSVACPKDENVRTHVPPAADEKASVSSATSFAGALPAETAAKAALAAVDAVLTTRPEAVWAKCGCGDLDAASCARTAAVSSAFFAAAQGVARFRVHRALAGTQLWDDADNPGESPFLALSHLESLASTSFVFSAARDLLRSCGIKSAPRKRRRACKEQPRPASARELGGRAWLVEVSVGDNDEDLPAALTKIVLGDMEEGAHGAADGITCAASVQRHITDMLRQFEPQEHWAPAVLDAVGSLVGGEVVLQRAAEGSSLAEMLLGVGALLPKTRSGAAAQHGLPVRPAALLCQLLERLVFPPREAPLVLRFSCNPRESTLDVSAPDADSAVADEALRAQQQEATFECARRALEVQLRLHGADGAEFLEVLCLKPRRGMCHVLIVERGDSSAAARPDGA